MRRITMSMEKLKSIIPDYGRDIRLNLDSVLAEETAPGLDQGQIWAVALACAYSLGSKDLVEAVLGDGQSHLDDATREAARGAATIMAMNNVYYRAMHLMEDDELKALPAKLRMNFIGKPGIDKVNFELMSFAISALAGCGQCLSSHLNEIRKAGVSSQGAQSALRIASVFQATDRVLKIIDSQA